MDSERRKERTKEMRDGLWEKIKGKGRKEDRRMGNGGRMKKR
jgi:hypothetical protein